VQLNIRKSKGEGSDLVPKDTVDSVLSKFSEHMKGGDDICYTDDIIVIAPVKNVTKFIRKYRRFGNLNGEASSGSPTSLTKNDFLPLQIQALAKSHGGSVPDG
jgi:hypothetical protein